MQNFINFIHLLLRFEMENLNEKSSKLLELEISIDKIAAI